MAKKIDVTSLPKELTTSEAADLLGVTTMSLYHYRYGKCSSKTALPFHTEPRGTERHRVYFKRHELVQWARKNGFEI